MLHNSNFSFSNIGCLFVCESVDGVFVSRLIFFNCENKTYNSRNLHLKPQGKMFWRRAGQLAEVLSF